MTEPTQDENQEETASADSLGQASSPESPPEAGLEGGSLTPANISEEGGFTVEPANSAFSNASKLTKPELRPYNPDEFHDKARRVIALALLGLLASVIIIFVLGLFALCPKPTVSEYKSILEMLLTPLLTLVSAATGFYFGSKK